MPVYEPRLIFILVTLILVVLLLIGPFKPPISLDQHYGVLESRASHGWGCIMKVLGYQGLLLVFTMIVLRSVTASIDFGEMQRKQKRLAGSGSVAAGETEAISLQAAQMPEVRRVEGTPTAEDQWILETGELIELMKEAEEIRKKDWNDLNLWDN